MTARPWWGILIALAVLTVAPLPASAATINASVTIRESGYSPATVTIRPGEHVIWVNGGTRDHTVTSDSGTQINSGAITPGNEFSLRFAKAGTYSYHSAFLRDHMRGTVVVAGAPAEAAVVTVTVTTPASALPYRTSVLEDLRRAQLRDVTITSPLLVRLARDEGDEAWWSVGLVVAATLTAVAVVAALLAYGRREQPATPPEG